MAHAHIQYTDTHSRYTNTHTPSITLPSTISFIYLSICFYILLFHLSLTHTLSYTLISRPLYSPSSCSIFRSSLLLSSHSSISSPFFMLFCESRTLIPVLLLAVFLFIFLFDLLLCILKVSPSQSLFFSLFLSFFYILSIYFSHSPFSGFRNFFFPLLFYSSSSCYPPSFFL